MRCLLLLLLIAALLALAASPAVPARCCCTGKIIPAPFADGRCCGGSPSSCCMKRAPSPVAAPAELRPASPVQPDLQIAAFDAAIGHAACTPPAVPCDAAAARVPLPRPSLAQLSVLRV